MAKQGLRFTQFYNCAKCGPTRSSLLTGLYVDQPELYKYTSGEYQKPINSVTIAELLKSAGYRTLMTGKWHNGSRPTQRGFDRYFGLLDGAVNYFNPSLDQKSAAKGSTRTWGIEDTAFEAYDPPNDDFYTTDDWTNYALNLLDEYGRDSKPFFLYMAYNAPHYPMQAWPEDIAKYRGKYMKGWEAVREERYKRMLKMGILTPSTELSPPDEGSIPWDTLNDKDKKHWDLLMSIYAAMVDRADQNIGKLLAKIKELGIENNTLVMFLSDNGGCHESLHLTPGVTPGGVDSYDTYDLSWANASNTPFRKFKRWSHEGGVSTPFIVKWPGVVKNEGALTRQPGHVIDIMATCADVAGVEYPKTFDGRDILPLNGISLLPIFKGKQRKGHDAIFWKYSDGAAVRKGKWKLVRPQEGDTNWYLYDIENDRTELHDLKSTYPEKAKELLDLWTAWDKQMQRNVAARKKKAGEG